MTGAGSVHPDLTGMAAVHEIYRASLRSAPAYIQSAEGDDRRRALIVNFYANVLASLENHHVGEDELYFPLLIERAPEHAGVVNQGFAEHQQVRESMAAARVALAAWESTGDAEGPELVRILGALDDPLSLHCEREEATIVPLLTEHLSEEEMAALPAHGRANFSGDKYWLIVGLRLEYSSPEERASVLGHMSPSAREWWETEGKPSFSDMMAELEQRGR